MFRGSFTHALDDKGRSAIPAVWRERLLEKDAGRLIVTRFISGGASCLDAYPQSEWEKLENKMMDQPRFSKVAQWFDNFYVARAHDCQMDKQGRVLLPQLLREHAKLGKEVVFAGALSKFRIWNVDAWAQVEIAAERDFEDGADFLEGVDL